MAVDDALLELERRLLSDAAGKWLADIAEIKRLYALDSPTLAAFIRGLAPSLDVAAVQAGVLEAYGVGANYAGITAFADKSLSEAQKLAVGQAASYAPASIMHGLDKLAPDADGALAKALKLLQAGATIESVLAPLLGNGTATRARIIDLVHGAGAKATLNVAKAADKPVVWVAERDACVRCLAHSGHYVEVGQPFPPGLSYGRLSLDDVVGGPPLHPHCRCHLEVLNDPAYAAALRREADRSVLRGYSLESEPMSVRVDAAKRLVESGVDAPKSVIAVATRAVKNGRFPTRTVPKAKPPTQGPPRGSGPVPPKPPRAPRPPKPKTPPRVPLSKTLSDVSAPAEMAKLAQTRHPGTDWSAWTGARGLDAANSRTAIGQVSDLLDDFPGAKLSEVKPHAIRNNNVFAQVRTPVMRDAAGKKIMGTPGMEISSGFLRNPDRLSSLVEAGSKSGHFHGVSGGDAMLHTVTHEFGHVLDSNSQNALSRLFTKMKNEALSQNGATIKNGAVVGYSKEAYEWSSANISGYGRTSASEGVAELFAEGRLKGKDAAPFAQAFYGAAMDLLKEKGLAK